MGTTVSGLLDAVGICMSIGLQSGVPLEWFTTKLKGMRFEPEGGTNDADIRHASSMIDAVMRWVEKRFAKKEPPAPLPAEESPVASDPEPEEKKAIFEKYRKKYLKEMYRDRKRRPAKKKP
jgi:hypothetical protein